MLCAQTCGGGSHSASIARHRCMLYAVLFRVGVVFTVASRTGCRPCFHPGWSRVFGGQLHNITCVSEGTLGQDNRGTAGQAGSTTCAAQHTSRHCTPICVYLRYVEYLSEAISIICVRRYPIPRVAPLEFRGPYMRYRAFTNTDNADTTREVLQIDEIHASGTTDRPDTHAGICQPRTHRMQIMG